MVLQPTEDKQMATGAGLRLVDSSQGLKELREGDLVLIAMPLIAPDPDQPRKEFDEKRLQSLAASMKACGVNKQAIQVRIRSNGKGLVAFLTAGERRWRGGKIAQLPALKSEVVSDISDVETLLDQLAENVNRVQLGYVETAEAIEKILSERPKMSMAAIAERIGCTENYLVFCRKLLRLNGKMRELLKQGKLHALVAHKVADFPPEKQDEAHAEIIRHAKSEERKGRKVTPSSLAQDTRKVVEKAGIKPKQMDRGRRFQSSETLTLSRFVRIADGLVGALAEVGQIKEDKIVLSELGLPTLKKKVEEVIEKLEKELQRLKKMKNISR